jgi:Asp-tRNA(Asn)/Glu-tRNA(Gln) amidotransferase A subunit family amidase
VHGQPSILIRPESPADLSARPLPDDPELLNGAQVGIQLVGKRLEEEKVIEMTKVVLKALAAVKGEHQPSVGA